MEKDFQLRGSIEDIPGTRDQIVDFIRECGHTDRPDYNLLVAVQEALANAVVHGCRSDPTKVIRCHVKCDHAGISISVHDPGPGFDVRSLGDPTAEDALCREHGRGIFMLRSLMDEVRFENGGRSLEMRKMRRFA